MLSVHVQALTSNYLRELRVLRAPPASVLLVLEALGLLLGVADPQSVAGRRKILQDNLPDRLHNFDLEAMTLGQIKKLRRLLGQPGFGEESIRAVCPAAVPLAAWCRAVGDFLSKSAAQDVPGAPPPEEKALDDRPLREPLVQQQEDVSSHAHEAPEKQSLVVSPDLSQLSLEELAEVHELEVMRPGVGSIVFHGATDVRDLDIVSLVHLDIGEVLVYPAQGLKPPPGEGLNKLATVTMHQCWPPNGRGHLEDPSSRERYRGKIKQMTEEKRARFIDYDCTTGVWKFQVDHF